MALPRFAVRKVRNGRVKIAGVWYYANDPHREYKGELDGGRYAFGRYYIDLQPQPYVSLWGSEAEFNINGTFTEEEFQTAWRAVAHTNKTVIDGYIYWSWWRPKPTKRHDSSL